MSKKATDTDSYQQKIAEEYKKRVSSVSPEEVQHALGQMGFSIQLEDIKTAQLGNMSATFLSKELAIKINKDRNNQQFLPNVEVSSKLHGQPGIIEVLDYDAFEKTHVEVLVMKRAPGTCLLSDIFELNQDQLAGLFRRVLQVVNVLSTLKYPTFSNFKLFEPKYQQYSDLLKYEFEAHCKTILNQQLCASADVAKVRDYFMSHLSVFDDETAVFVHHDIHMGNILHQGDQLTALLDYDASGKAPKITVLPTLLGFIGNPSQFTEGTPDFQKYKGKNFLFLLPVLREELSNLFSDPQLLRKLNLLSIAEGVMWIAGNWSEAYNKEMMTNIINHELVSDADLGMTSFGKLLS